MSIVELLATERRQAGTLRGVFVACLWGACILTGGFMRFDRFAVGADLEFGVAYPCFMGGHGAGVVSFH